MIGQPKGRSLLVMNGGNVPVAPGSSTDFNKSIYVYAYCTTEIYMMSLLLVM